MSGSPDGGSHDDAPLVRSRDCSSAPANCGLCGPVSAAPNWKRDTVSTPAQTNASPSLALIACAAMRMACSDDEQYRLTVTPGTSGMSASTAATRATLYPDSPPGWPQPQMRSS